MANAAVWAALLLLLATRGPELLWAARALPALLQGRFEPLREAALYERGVALLRDGGDLARAEALLERSLAIDPNSTALFALAEVHRRRGDAGRARALYERYLAIDPHFVSAYLRLAELLGRAGEAAERERLLREGLARLRRRARAWRPVAVSGADPAAAEKARRSHAYLARGVRALESALAGGVDGTPPGG